MKDAEDEGKGDYMTREGRAKRSVAVSSSTYPNNVKRERESKRQNKEDAFVENWELVKFDEVLALIAQRR